MDLTGLIPNWGEKKKKKIVKKSALTWAGPEVTLSFSEKRLWYSWRSFLLLQPSSSSCPSVVSYIKVKSIFV